MPLPAKPTRPLHETGRDSDESSTPSNNLWVGNLTPDVRDSDLMDLFAQYGALDSVTSYSARSYAFVFFKRIEDAKAAKNALQGFSFRGNSLKIEFARPARPCKQLWVGGISPAVTKEDLEADFRKFGKIEDYKFIRERNTACVEFFNLDDAIQAMKIMNGKRIGGENIRVDFLRSNSTKKEQLLDYGQFQGKSSGPTDSYSGQKRPLNSQPLMGRKGDGQPSNILWIGYPPNVQIDEQMLHNAMILFGEIERIKSFPSRNYSFVEFRSVDEARRAKEGLQGRLFNDPRITINFSNGDQAHGKDYPGFYPGSNGPRPDLFLNEHSYRPLQMDLFGHNRPMVPNNFPGHLPTGGIVGPNIQMRPFGPQSGHESIVSGPEFNENSTIHKFQDGSSANKNGPNWKRPSPPAPGLLSSPVPGARLPARSASGAWDVLDINHNPRDSKRSRIDGALPNDDPYGGRGILGPAKGVPGSVQPGGLDHIWRGLIAKGGTPVCRARCVPVGKGIGTELPEVVDCSARTGLDTLEKHYAEAIDFEIVFFLPDSEEDFASYTEFLRYLGAKYRAGVAKFIDGTTLFLVPPSDFLTKVLKVTGPERLYGVVLKFAPVPSGAPVHQPPHLPAPSNQYMQQRPPSQAEYDMNPAKEEQVLPMDYNRMLHEDSKLPAKQVYPPTGGPPSVQAAAPDYAPNTAASGSQSRVALTPELIATLATFLPTNAQSSATDGAMSAVGSSTAKPPFPHVAPNDANQSQLWKQDHQIADQSIHPPQQFRNMYNSHNAHYQPYPPASAPGHTAQVFSGSSHIQDNAVSQQQQGVVSSRHMSNFVTPNQSGQVAASSHFSHQYQADVPPNTQKGYGVVPGSDSSVLYNSQAFQQPNSNSQLFQQPNNSIALSSQVNSANPQHQPAMQYAADQINSNPHIQQNPAFGAAQGTPELDSDKNQRYQSTLQFAANLLLQIQQQQTQGGHQQ
ncbi:unnamed protein product [Trifolium pratense]|uniref:Uncharacterized protein n=2 Tax=Trifolium pratense TaxID=57577 RepID=A0ACB0MC33_TRIPR|nr:unnamed protein product [Trifolium pratense]